MHIFSKLLIEHSWNLLEFYWYRSMILTISTFDLIKLLESIYRNKVQ